MDFGTAHSLLDPGVGEQVAGGGTPVGVLLKHEGDYFSGFRGDFRPFFVWELHFSSQDSTVDFGFGRAVEGGKAAYLEPTKEHIEDNSAAPHVTFLIIMSGLEDFRGYVVGSAHYFGGVFVIGAAGSEVYDFEEGVLTVVFENEGFRL